MPDAWVSQGTRCYGCRGGRAGRGSLSLNAMLVNGRVRDMGSQVIACGGRDVRTSVVLDLPVLEFRIAAPCQQSNFALPGEDWNSSCAPEPNVVGGSRCHENCITSHVLAHVGIGTC